MTGLDDHMVDEMPLEEVHRQLEAMGKDARQVQRRVKKQIQRGGGRTDRPPRGRLTLIHSLTNSPRRIIAIAASVVALALAIMLLIQGPNGLMAPSSNTITAGETPDDNVALPSPPVAAQTVSNSLQQGRALLESAALKVKEERLLDTTSDNLQLVERLGLRGDITLAIQDLKMAYDLGSRVVPSSDWPADSIQASKTRSALMLADGYILIGNNREARTWLTIVEREGYPVQSRAQAARMLEELP